MRGPRTLLTGTLALTAALALLPAGTAAAATASALPRCGDATTRVTAEVEQPASGNDAIAVHVTATTACVTGGYPSAAVLDATGAVAGTARREPAGYFGGLPTGTTPPRITLRAGQQATALVQFSNRAEPGGRTCPSWPALRVGLPRAAGSTTLAVTSTACPRTLTVDPRIAGATGTG